MPPLLVVAFLAVHGLIHASFLTPAPEPKPGAPQWPFDLARSWALTPLGVDATVTRGIGVVLVGAVLAGYTLAAAAAIGIAPGAWFAPLLATASVASLAILALFFHPWLVLGFVIDAVLLWAVLARGWTPGPMA